MSFPVYTLLPVCCDMQTLWRSCSPADTELLLDPTVQYSCPKLFFSLNKKIYWIWDNSGCLWIFSLLRDFPLTFNFFVYECAGIGDLNSGPHICTGNALSHEAIFPAQIPLFSCSEYFVHIVCDDCRSHWLLGWGT